MDIHMKRWLRVGVIALSVVAVLATTGCEAAGAADSDGTIDGDSNTDPPVAVVTVRGQTTLANEADEEDTQTAVFSFDVPESVVNATINTTRLRRTSNDDEWAAVEGQVRAGNFLIDLSGAYNQSTKAFTLRAVGEVLNTTIELVIYGTHVPATGAIADASVSVSVSVDGTTTVYSSASVELTTGVPDNGTAQQATTPTPKYYEGTWRGSFVNYGQLLDEVWRTYPTAGDGRIQVTNSYVATVTRSYYDVVVTATAGEHVERMQLRHFFTEVPVVGGAIEMYIHPIDEEVPMARVLMTPQTGGSIKVEQYYMLSGPYSSLQDQRDEVFEETGNATTADPRNWTLKMDLGTMTRVN